LTVRRKNVLFKHLYSFGARTFERKHAVEIDLTEYELDMYLRGENRLRGEARGSWVTFVEEAVNRAGYPS